MNTLQLIRSIIIIIAFNFGATYATNSANANANANPSFMMPALEKAKNTKTIVDINDSDTKPFSTNTKAGRNLISASRNLNEEEGDDGSELGSSYLGDYAIKFHNCQSVTQWDGDDWTQGKVLSRRLVRYRLCPLGSCDGSSDTGCSSKYGDFVVDLNTFLYYYLSAQTNANEVIDAYCQEGCNGNGSYDSCYDKCFSDNGGFTSTASNDGDSYDLDPLEFAQCGAFNDGYYLGPYCSDDGQSVHLGIFSDNACSTFSSCDATCFYNTYNSTLSYDSTSMVSNNCLSCSDGTIQDGYATNSAVDECTAVYGDSGKCETKMSIDYPNESGCTYIQGLKSIGYDGVISSKGAKKSKEAGLAIGLLSFSSMLLAVYVYFLYSKLDRARYHLME